MPLKFVDIFFKLLLIILSFVMVSSASSQGVEVSPRLCNRASNLSQGLAEEISRVFSVERNSVALQFAVPYGSTCDVRINTDKGLVRCTISTSIFSNGRYFWIHGNGSMCKLCSISCNNM
jgi:hypothetical protein